VQLALLAVSPNCITFANVTNLLEQKIVVAEPLLPEVLVVFEVDVELLQLLPLPIEAFSTKVEFLGMPALNLPLPQVSWVGFSKSQSHRFLSQSPVTE
jgi:hypothetical protein